MLYLRRIVVLGLVALSLTCGANHATAQESMPANTKIAVRPMYTEAAVVVLLIGGAIFAVCRGSRRM
jgi:hypothetical protein